MRKHLLYAIAVVVGLILGIGAGASASTVTPPHHPAWMTHPCKSESSINCYWNATEQGNGVGHSYYVHRIGNLICVTYAVDSFAKHSDYCEHV